MFLIFFNFWQSKHGKQANGHGITGKMGQQSATCACSFKSAVCKGYTPLMATFMCCGFPPLVPHEVHCGSTLKSDLPLFVGPLRIYRPSRNLFKFLFLLHSTYAWKKKSDLRLTPNPPPCPSTAKGTENDSFTR